MNFTRPKLGLPPGTAPRGVVARTPPPAAAAFHVVWARGRRGPRYKHPTREAAMAEAQRLADLDHGRLFEVFACVPAGSVQR
jgi:hypothetical protein